MNKKLIKIFGTAFLIPVTIASADDKGLSGTIYSSIYHDDNIYRTIESAAISDEYFNLNPKMDLIGGYGKQRYSIEYIGDYAFFKESKDANYDDHTLKGIFETEHSVRFSSKVEVLYQREHEDPGSINRIQLDITEYNKYEQKLAKAQITYGRDDSVGRISIDYERNNKEYLTNDLYYLDFKSNRLGMKFSYKIAPKTKLYLEGIATDYDYTPALNYELDNTYARYRAGIEWDVSGKLSGNIAVGYQDRNYDLESLRDINGIAYNGSIDWKVNTYTSIGITAKRESIDSSIENSGGFLRTTYSTSLLHEITPRTKLKMDFGFSEDELVFTAERNDKRYAAKSEVEYEVLRNLKASVSYIYEERDSTEHFAKFKANILGIYLTYSLEN